MNKDISFAELFENSTDKQKGMVEKKKEDELRDRLIDNAPVSVREAQEIVDLHGLTREQAIQQTRLFIGQSRKSGLKRVRIICGIGRNSPNGVAKLRPVISAELVKMISEKIIKDFFSAEPRHGGYGALEVIIK